MKYATAVPGYEVIEPPRGRAGLSPYNMTYQAPLDSISDMHRYTRLIPYVTRQWPGLALIASMTVLASLMTALQPWPVKLLVDYALGGEAIPAALGNALRYWSLDASTPVLIAVAVGASLALFGLGHLLDAGLTWTWAVTGQRMNRGLATDLFARMQRLSLGFHRRHPLGDSLSRLTDDTWAIYKVADEIMIGPVQSVVAFATVGIVAWQLSPRLAALSLVTAPLMAAAAMFFGTPLKRRARAGREAQSRLLSCTSSDQSGPLSLFIKRDFLRARRLRRHV